MRVGVLILTILVLSCSTGYRATTRSFGLEARELAGARRIYLGEAPHIGMPHVTLNPEHASKAAAVFKRELPAIQLVSSPREAEFVISVLFTAGPACSHCAVGPESQWIAIVERGGVAHQDEYSSIALFLELRGKVREGDSVTRGFTRQVADLLLRHNSQHGD